MGRRLEHVGVGDRVGRMGFLRLAGTPAHPLADIARALGTYKATVSTAWSDPDDPCICARRRGRIYEQARYWDRESTFLVDSHRDTLWEKSYMLAGMASMMAHCHAAPVAVRQ